MTTDPEPKANRGFPAERRELPRGPVTPEGKAISSPLRPRRVTSETKVQEEIIGPAEKAAQAHRKIFNGLPVDQLILRQEARLVQQYDRARKQLLDYRRIMAREKKRDESELATD